LCAAANFDRLIAEENLMTTTAKTKPSTPKGFFDNVAEPLKDVGKTFEEARERTVACNSEISSRFIEYAETNTREAFDAARAAAGAKSVVELIEIQNTYLRDQATRGASQLRELGELVFKASQDAWAPITSKVAAALGRPTA
jgi:phasin family protein